jgi:hypothetical protein
VAARGARAAAGDAGRSETKEGLMENGFAKRFAKEWVAAHRGRARRQLRVHRALKGK